MAANDGSGGLINGRIVENTCTIINGNAGGGMHEV